MGLFDNFPYTNFHELNLDAIIKILRDMQDEWAATKDEWADMKEFVTHYFETLDVSEEVSDRIKLMAKDGTLYSIIQPDISSTVTTWLASHISGETVPAVDRSLTVEGAAADAYITGNNIRALNEFNTRDLAKLYRHTDRDHSGINFHWTSGGSCQVTGTSVATAQVFMWDDVNSLPDGMYPGQTLYIDYSSTITYLDIYFYKDGVYLSGPSLTIPRTITVPSDATGATVRLRVKSGNTVNETVRPIIRTTESNKYLSDRVMIKKNGSEDVEVLTNYSILNGYISTVYNVLDNGHHTSLIAVYPDKYYYVPELYEDLDVLGAFYDTHTHVIDTIQKDDTVVTGGIMRRILTPHACRYISLNVTPRYYGASLCSKPLIFPGRQELNPTYPPRISVPNLGNFAISGTNKTLQSKRNKKLCCIGDSLTYINRRKENGINLGNLMFGWQEYPGLLYNSVTSYGFSGGTWGPAAGYTDQNIYDGIVTAGVDLSDYDDFILFAGYNGMGEGSYEMGTLGTYNENTSGTSTMLGAMRGVIDYIMQQNPKAKIYIMTNPHTGGYYRWQTYRTRLQQYRDEIMRIAPLIGVEVIDAEVNAGFTKALYDTNTITYDDIHPNDNGMAMIGMCALNTIMSK